MSTPDAPPPGGGDDQGRGLSGVQRAGMVLGGLAVLLIAFVIFRGGDDSGSQTSSSAADTTTAQTTTTTATTTTSGSTSTGDSGTTSTSTDGSGAATTDRSGSETGTTTTTTQAQPAQPAVRTIRVVNGQPQGGVRTLSYKKGDRVRFKVRSDVADEIHVHGYDLKRDVTAGGTAQFSFVATIEGRFEVELENAHVQIAQLEVSPS
jgi:hypothetical protein